MVLEKGGFYRAEEFKTWRESEAFLHTFEKGLYFGSAMMLCCVCCLFAFFVFITMTMKYDKQGFCCASSAETHRKI